MEPVTLRVHRLWPGIWATSISVVLAVAGAILWILMRGEESKVPQSVFSIACLGGASFTARIANRDLRGTLTVDDAGIRLSPRFCGLRLWWSEVSMWCLEGDGRSALFRFWKSGNNVPRTLPAKWFLRDGRERLTQALRSFASDKARRF